MVILKTAYSRSLEAVLETDDPTALRLRRWNEGETEFRNGEQARGI